MLKVLTFMKQVANGLQVEGNFGTAHVYRSSLNAIIAYSGKVDFTFDEVSPEWLKGFEVYLRSRGCSWNTVSTYLRTFRAVYNRAVDLRKASYVPHLFRSVYTGTRADHKRALGDEDMKKVFLLAFVLFAWSMVVNAQESDGKYIEVTGSSEIEVVPDEIHFLIQIKEYWQEEYTGKSNKEEDFRTKVPLAMIEKDLRRSLRKIGIADDAIRTQEIGDYWRQRGKEFLIGKQLDIQLTDFEQINSIIRSVNTWGIESMRIGELKHKDLPMYRKQGKIEALKAAREKASYLVEAMGQELGEVIRIVEPVDNNISRYLPFQAQSNVSMGTAATEQYRVIKLRYEMTARFAIK